MDPTAPGTPNPNQPSAPPSYVDDEELNPVTRTVLASIAKSIRAAVRAGEDKVGLAVMMHESVSLSFRSPSRLYDRSYISALLQIDRHIRRLDSDLAKYEDSLVIGLRDDTLPAHDAPSLTANQPPGPTTLLGAIALGESSPFPKFSPPKSPPKVSRKLPPSPPRQSESLPVDKGKGRVSFDSVAVARSEVAERNRIRDRDAKRTKREQERQQKELLGEGSAKKGGSSGRREVERDSTRYCTCRRVSFGQASRSPLSLERYELSDARSVDDWMRKRCLSVCMGPFSLLTPLGSIADTPSQFHLECVNLSAPPIGKWYCATCCDKLGIIDQFAKLRKR